MRGPTGVARRMLAVLALVGVAVVCGPLPAHAALRSPKLIGSITGSAKRGARITFHLVTTVPGGFQNVATLQIALLLHSAILDQIDYDQQRNAISTPSSLAVPVGSRFAATGLFLQSNGRDVRIGTAGDRLTFTLGARMVQDAPAGAQFSLAAIDDLNQVTRITRPVRLPQPPKGGFSWGDLALAAAAALFVGAFVGNLFGNRRSAPPKVAVYDVLRRRIDMEKVGE
jgi:hypothetical protein